MKRCILTTAIQAVSNLLVSVNMLLKEALDFGLIVWQFVWAHCDQILLKATCVKFLDGVRATDG